MTTYSINDIKNMLSKDYVVLELDNMLKQPGNYVNFHKMLCRNKPIILKCLREPILDSHQLYATMFFAFGVFRFESENRNQYPFIRNEYNNPWLLAMAKDLKPICDIQCIDEFCSSLLYSVIKTGRFEAYIFLFSLGYEFDKSYCVNTILSVMLQRIHTDDIIYCAAILALLYMSRNVTIDLSLLAKIHAQFYVTDYSSSNPTLKSTSNAVSAASMLMLFREKGKCFQEWWKSHFMRPGDDENLCDSLIEHVTIIDDQSSMCNYITKAYFKFTIASNLECDITRVISVYADLFKPSMLHLKSLKSQKLPDLCLLTQNFTMLKRVLNTGIPSDECILNAFFLSHKLHTMWSLEYAELAPITKHLLAANTVTNLYNISKESLHSPRLNARSLSMLIKYKPVYFDKRESLPETHDGPEMSCLCSLELLRKVIIAVKRFKKRETIHTLIYASLKFLGDETLNEYIRTLESIRKCLQAIFDDTCFNQITSVNSLQVLSGLSIRKAFCKSGHDYYSSLDKLGLPRAIVQLMRRNFMNDKYKLCIFSPA